MGSMADKIIEKNKQRQAALAGKTATPTPVKAPVKIGTAEEAKEKVEKKPAPQGNPKYKCGHEVQIKQAMNQDCPACVERNRQKKQSGFVR